MVVLQFELMNGLFFFCLGSLAMIARVNKGLLVVEGVCVLVVMEGCCSLEVTCVVYRESCSWVFETSSVKRDVGSSVPEVGL